LHARQSSPAYAELVAEARQIWAAGERCLEQGRNLDLLEQDLRRQQSLDPALVSALATAKADGYSRWQQARQDSDFSLFAPALQTLIDLRQEQARQLAEPRSCWETLAQPFEPDLTLDRLMQLFAPLKERLGGRGGCTTSFPLCVVGAVGDCAAVSLRPTLDELGA
jgi:carboxypeptidase Taq